MGTLAAVTNMFIMAGSILYTTRSSLCIYILLGTSTHAQVSSPSYEGLNAPEPSFGSWHHSRQIFGVSKYFSPRPFIIRPSLFRSFRAPPTAPSATATFNEHRRAGRERRRLTPRRSGPARHRRTAERHLFLFRAPFHHINAYFFS